MYEIDGRDRAVRVDRWTLPPSDPVAPYPLVLADDSSVVLAYFLPSSRPRTESTREAGVGTSEERFGLVRFDGCMGHYFGGPNDEARSNHPLFDRGLSEGYDIFEVQDSSWGRLLEELCGNRIVDEKHRHFVFAFKECLFECVCRRFEATVVSGASAAMLPRMAEKLGEPRA